MKFSLQLLCFLSALSASGQHLKSEFFSTKSGLPQSQVTTLAEDKKFGYLWVGTNGGGAAQFDGTSFKTYTIEDGLIDNTINRILIDQHDNVWFATPKGLTRFDGKNFKNFDLPLAGFTALFEHRDTIIAITRSFGTIKIKGDSLQKDAKGYETKITPLIVTIIPNQLYTLKDEQIIYENEEGIRSTIDISALGILYSLRRINNQPYFITSTGTYRIKKQKVELVDARINFSIISANHDFSTVWKWDGGSLIEIQLGSTLQYDTIAKNTRIFSGLVDSEGNSWFGTDGRGLMKRHPADFEKVYDDIAMAIQEHGAQLWVGSHGVKVLEDRKLKKRFSIKNDQGADLVSSMKKDSKGNIWAVGGFIMTRINPITGAVKKFTIDDGLRFSFVYDLEIDKNDKVWISYNFWSRSGIQLYDGSTIRDFEFNHKLSSPVVITTKYIPYGDRMLFLTENGVDQFVKGAVSKLKIPTFEQTSIYCAVPYKSNMAIIGSEGRGICIYNFDTNVAKHFSVKEGLASGLIYFLNIDAAGYVWVGSNRGIEKILFNKNLEVQEYIHFSEANGLTELETNLNASYFSADRKYFGLIDGLYQYTGNEKDSTKDFALHLTDISLINSRNDVSTYGDKGNGFFKIPTHLRLPWDENSIKFSFSKVSKKHPNSTDYRFQLEGLDREWSRQSTEEVTYRNLPNGNYTFKVVARDMDGKWMATPLVYSFTILPPLYKQPWFVVLSILLMVLLIIYLNYYSIKRRIKRILQLEKTRLDENLKLRKEIGRDFHDEIGNQLARIVNYVGLIKLNQGNSHETLTRVEESAQSLIGGTKDFVWALDHTNDSSTSLFIHLKDFGDRLFDEKGIEFRAFNEIDENMELPIGHTRQINLIFKEAMTNAFKYSQATQVNLYFRKVLFKLTIVIEDNGVGFSDKKLNLPSGGLSNMKTRANRINAKLVITPEPGTQIKLIV
jgi:signal transduction histidine kinase/ligand-binding sensor domain-containing protein